MTSRPLRTILIGAGRIGAGYADDKNMARFIPYASHAQVLSSHPHFEWGAVVDRSREVAVSVGIRYCVPLASEDISDAIIEYDPEVAVLTLPPEAREDVVVKLPNLRAVIVEKPLGASLGQAEHFLEVCKEQGILVQVNLWRRADTFHRSLLDGGLQELIGEPQALICLYGNGLRNNGTHMVDAARMLVGEFASITAVGPPRKLKSGPTIAPRGEDVGAFFTGEFVSGATASFHPLDFDNFRENGLEIWGTKGRLDILNEGLSIKHSRSCPNRAVDGEFEVDSDNVIALSSTAGTAYYEIYSNLFDAIETGSRLWIPGHEALQSTQVISAVEESLAANGVAIHLCH